MTIRCCLLAFLLAGCGSPAATAPGSASPSILASAVATAPASAAPTSSAAPSDAFLPPLPSDFPTHDSMVERDPTPGTIASWTANALPPDIYAFYLDALVDAGFEIDLEAPGGAVAILRFHAPDGTAYQLDFGGNSPVEVVLGPPRP